MDDTPQLIALDEAGKLVGIIPALAYERLPEVYREMEREALFGFKKKRTNHKG